MPNENQLKDASQLKKRLTSRKIRRTWVYTRKDMNNRNMSDFERQNQMSDWMSDRMSDLMVDRISDRMSDQILVK